MTMQDGTTEKAPVETKVKAGAAFSYLAGLALLAVLNGTTDTDLVSGLPDWIEAFVAPAVPGAASFLAGYLAKHTRRGDLGK